MIVQESLSSNVSSLRVVVYIMTEEQSSRCTVYKPCIQRHKSSRCSVYNDCTAVTILKSQLAKRCTEISSSHYTDHRAVILFVVQYILTIVKINILA